MTADNRIHEALEMAARALDEFELPNQASRIRRSKDDSLPAIIDTLSLVEREVTQADAVRLIAQCKIYLGSERTSDDWDAYFVSAMKAVGMM